MTVAEFRSAINQQHQARWTRQEFYGRFGRPFHTRVDGTGGWLYFHCSDGVACAWFTATTFIVPMGSLAGQSKGVIEFTVGE